MERTTMMTGSSANPSTTETTLLLTPERYLMHPEDVLRETEKVLAALLAAEKHLTHFNEMNAALHLSDRVLYSPLTTVVIAAVESARKLVDDAFIRANTS